jgi:hypothetical protein
MAGGTAISGCIDREQTQGQQPGTAVEQTATPDRPTSRFNETTVSVLPTYEETGDWGEAVQRLHDEHAPGVTILHPTQVYEQSSTFQLREDYVTLLGIGGGQGAFSDPAPRIQPTTSLVEQILIDSEESGDSVYFFQCRHLNFSGAGQGVDHAINNRGGRNHRYVDLTFSKHNDWCYVSRPAEGAGNNDTLLFHHVRLRRADRGIDFREGSGDLITADCFIDQIWLSGLEGIGIRFRNANHVYAQNVTHTAQAEDTVAVQCVHTGDVKPFIVRNVVKNVQSEFHNRVPGTCVEFRADGQHAELLAPVVEGISTFDHDAVTWVDLNTAKGGSIVSPELRETNGRIQFSTLADVDAGVRDMKIQVPGLDRLDHWTDVIDDDGTRTMINDAVSDGGSGAPDPTDYAAGSILSWSGAGDGESETYVKTHEGNLIGPL